MINHLEHINDVMLSFNIVNSQKLQYDTGVNNYCTVDLIQDPSLRYEP